MTSYEVVLRRLPGGTAIVTRIRTLICAVRPGYEGGVHKVQWNSVTTPRKGLNNLCRYKRVSY